MTDDIQVRFLSLCPACKKPWLAIPSSSTIVPAVENFLKALKEATHAFHDWRDTMNALSQPGFSIDLEITAPTAKT